MAAAATAPVTYRAWQKEKPILVGGRAITGFAPWKGPILKADVARAGIQGRSLPPALLRRPAAAPRPLSELRSAESLRRRLGLCRRQARADVSGRARRGQTLLQLQGRRTPAPGRGPTEVEVFVFPRYNWWNNIVPHQVARPRHAPRSRWPATAPTRSAPATATTSATRSRNSTRPGEWYLDQATGTLYFWPPAPLDGKAGRTRRPRARFSRSAPAPRTSRSAASPSSAAKARPSRSRTPPTA